VVLEHHLVDLAGDDQVRAGLVLAVLAAREGRNAWRGDLCCAPSATSKPDETGHARSEGCCSS
jgi:hypothetical protein